MPGELIGEICLPSELTVPGKAVADQTNLQTGQIFLSGGKLCFYTGSAIETVTSA